MESLQQHVSLAARRMTLALFLRAWAIALAGGLTVALLAIGLGKILPLENLFGIEVESRLWAVSWLGGAALAATLGAAIWAYVRRPRTWEAAFEIDRRFELRERVTSALTLAPELRNAPTGAALLNDALRRTERIDIPSKFALGWSPRALWSLVPGIAAFALMFLADATNPVSTAQANPDSAKLAKQLKDSTEPLAVKLAEQRKMAEEQNDAKTAEFLKTLESEAMKLAEKADKGELDREKAVTQLNELAKKVAEERDRRGGQDEMKKQLNQLKNPGQGPAQDMAQAMKNADYEKAADEIKKLAEKLGDPKMSDEDKKKLAEQLESMKKQLENQLNSEKKQAEELAQRKESLEQQIKEAEQRGDQQQADDLKKQLEQTERQLAKANQNADRNQQAQQLAKSLQQAADGLKNGDAAQAQQAMQEMQQQMGDLAQQNQQMQTLQQAMDMIGESKAGVSGEKPAGQSGRQMAQGPKSGAGNQPGKSGSGGEAGSQSQGSGSGEDGGEGSLNAGGGIGGLKAGVGRGPSFGKEKADDGKTKFRDSKVAQEIGQGQAQIVGEAGGPNKAGTIREQIKVEAQSVAAERAESINRQRLPKHQRDQVKEYFDSLRDGK